MKTHQVSMLSGSEGLYSPRWSPDGRYICALTADNGKLLLFDLTTRKWMELAKMMVNFTSWSGDSKYIYFDSPSADDPALLRVRISDRKLERLVSLKNFRRTGNLWAWWFGLAPDDSPLLVRNVGTADIYALEWDSP